MNLDKIKRKLGRLKKRKGELVKLHSGNEQDYTYYGGWDMGFLDGQINAIETMLDEIDPEWEEDQ